MPDPEEWERRLRRQAGVTCLPYNLQVVIPYMCMPGCPKAYTVLREWMTKHFGGTTVFTAQGNWIDDRGRTVTDDVKVIESAHTCMDEKTSRDFTKIVGKAARMAHQDAISIKSGQYLIVPRKAFSAR